MVGVTGRVHRTVRAVPAEGLIEERARMRPLPARLPDGDRRFVTRRAAAVSARRSQRLLDRPRLRRPPRRATRLADRDHGDRAQHRRAGVPAPQGVCRRADVDRPGASERARAAARPVPPGSTPGEAAEQQMLAEPAVLQARHTHVPGRRDPAAERVRVVGNRAGIARSRPRARAELSSCHRSLSAAGDPEAQYRRAAGTQQRWVSSRCSRWSRAARRGACWDRPWRAGGSS